MKAIPVILIFAFTIAISGCSKESVKRATYGSGQLYGKQQCEREVSADCPEPDSYEEYQRKRKELNDSQ